MRLIDLDKVVSIYDEDNNAVIFANIKNAEIKAIPIEWIEKYKRVRGWEVSVTTQNAIDNMLNAWEKENEESSNRD